MLRNSDSLVNFWRARLSQLPVCYPRLYLSIGIVSHMWVIQMIAYTISAHSLPMPSHYCPHLPSALPSNTSPFPWPLLHFQCLTLYFRVEKWRKPGSFSCPKLRFSPWLSLCQAFGWALAEQFQPYPGILQILLLRGPIKAFWMNKSHLPSIGALWTQQMPLDLEVK